MTWPDALSQGDGAPSGHIAIALECRLGNVTLRQPLVAPGYVVASTTTPATAAAMGSADAAAGAGTGSADGDSDDYDEDRSIAAAGHATAGPADAVDGHGGGGRLSADAAAALWWTWWPLDLPVPALAFDDTTTALSAMHPDLRPLVTALVGDPSVLRSRSASMSGSGSDLPFLDRLRRSAWRPPRHAVRIVRNAAEPGAATVRLDEPAPLPSALPRRATGPFAGMAAGWVCWEMGGGWREGGEGRRGGVLLIAVWARTLGDP